MIDPTFTTPADVEAWAERLTRGMTFPPGDSHVLERIARVTAAHAHLFNEPVSAEGEK